MPDGKWIDLDVRQPGMRRILEALRQIEEEAPGLLDDAALAATELSKTRSDGGRQPAGWPRATDEDSKASH